MEVTEGCYALRMALARDRITQVKFAQQLGIMQGTVSSWVLAKTRPDAAQRIILEKVLGIAVSLWLTKEEQESIANLTTVNNQSSTVPIRVAG